MIVERVDPDGDDEWWHLVFRRTRRIGQRHEDDLAEDRTRAWHQAGSRGRDPGPLFTGRFRAMDVAIVHVPEQTVIGGNWTDEVELSCPGCGHVPKGLTYGNMASTVHQLAVEMIRGAAYV